MIAVYVLKALEIIVMTLIKIVIMNGEVLQMLIIVGLVLMAQLVMLPVFQIVMVNGVEQPK